MTKKSYKAAKIIFGNTFFMILILMVLPLVSSAMIIVGGLHYIPSIVPLSGMVLQSSNEYYPVILLVVGILLGILYMLLRAFNVAYERHGTKYERT